jgi:hypothetical protein
MRDKLAGRHREWRLQAEGGTEPMNTGKDIFTPASVLVDDSPAVLDDMG